jgi:hypothetical protein
LYGDSCDDFGESVQQTSDGGYVLAGFTMRSYHCLSADAIIIKTDSNGAALWSKAYGLQSPPALWDEVFHSVAQTSDGGYIAGGTRDWPNSQWAAFWLYKTDSNGDSVWSRVYGLTTQKHCYCVRQTADGGYIAAGRIVTQGVDFYLVRTDPDGNMLWDHRYGGSGDDECRSVVETSDGGYVLAGYTNSFGTGNYDFWMVGVSSSGDSLWSETFGGDQDEICYALQQTSDDGFILAGGQSSFEPGGIWLVKTGPDGPVYVPQDIVIQVAGDSLRLSWQDDVNRFYRVYSDSVAAGMFETLEGSTSDTTFTVAEAVGDSAMRFYQVVGTRVP